MSKRHGFWWLVRVALALMALVAGSAAQGVGETTEKPDKATGTVEIVWPGGEGGEGMGSSQMSPGAGEKRAFVELEWFEQTADRSAKGSFRYLVYKPDGSLHRVIVAEVGTDGTSIDIDPETGEGAFVGLVVSDVKYAGRHDDAASHDEGGTHDEGGCSGDDGGCSGTDDDGGTHDEGGDGSNANGAGSRVGQFVVVEIADLATPATAGDLIAWKWLSAPHIPTDLCPKVILGGNLKVHR